MLLLGITEVTGSGTPTPDYAWGVNELPVDLIGTAYTGPLFIARRGSDNAELTFYKGASINTFNTTRGGGGTDLLTWAGANNVFIKRLYSQISGKTDLLQASEANQPKIVSLGSLITVNGNAALEFVEADSTHLDCEDAVGMSVGGAWGSFTVTKRRASGKASPAFFSYAGTYGAYSPVAYTDNKFYSRSEEGYFSSDNTDATTSQILLSNVFTVSTRKLYKNGVEISGGFTTGPFTDKLRVLGQFDAAGVQCDGYFQCYLHFNQDLTATHVTVENNIISEFSL